MLHNFHELIITIQCCENQIVNLKNQIKYNVWRSNYKEIVILEDRVNLIRGKILKYIQAYKRKIQNCHLESKIYGSKLDILEEMYLNNNL